MNGKPFARSLGRVGRGRAAGATDSRRTLTPLVIRTSALKDGAAFESLIAMSDDVEAPSPSALLAMTAEIVSAYAGANAIGADALPALIQQVHQALAGAGASPLPAEARKQPAVPIKRSVFSDYIICLEDGHKAKMLKRYLAKRYGLTPDQYRAKWGLPRDYPMVAPAYSERRSTLAKDLGLGRKKPVEVEVKRIPKWKRGARRSKAKEEAE